VQAKPVVPEARSHVAPNTGDRVVAADASGAFRFRGLGPLDHTLRVLVPAGVAEAASVRVRPGASDVVLVTRAASPSSVRVRDPAGNPVRDAVVLWRRADAPPGVDPDRPISTSADGVATNRRFDPTASYAVTVKPPSRREDLAAVGPVPVRDGEVVLTLPTARSIEGVVLGPDGSPASHAWIWRASQDGRGSVARAGVDGRFRIDRLAPGVHRLLAAYDEPKGEPPYVEVDAGGDDVVLPLWGPPPSGEVQVK
jgi:hypothetical protein